MRLNGVLFVLLGVLLSLGGFFGFYLKNSLPSLLMGAFFGILLIISGIKTWKFSPRFETFGMVLSIFLDLFFGFRLLKTGKIFPAGLFVVIISLILIAVSVNLKFNINKAPD